MKIIMRFLAGVLFVWTTSVMAFDVTTEAKVVYIDEFDTAYTRVAIDKATSCGNNWFWMHRDMTGYDQYMARVLTAFVADKKIRINERAPGWCGDKHLYNPRIGIM